MEDNDFKATVTAIVAKVRNEAKREAARDAAYSAVQSVFRALGVKGVELSRASLWERPMDRSADLFDYVDEESRMYLLEMGHRLREFAPKQVGVDSLFDELVGSEPESFTAPQCPIDREALERQDS